MDRSLKWRTAALVIVTLLCVAIVLPSFIPRDRFPDWYNRIFSSKMSMGLAMSSGSMIPSLFMEP